MGALPNYAENATQEQAGRLAVHDLALKSEKPANFRLQAFVFCGSLTRTRTRDLRINRKPGAWKALQNQRFIAGKSIRAINRVIP